MNWTTTFVLQWRTLPIPSSGGMSTGWPIPTCPPWHWTFLVHRVSTSYLGLVAVIDSLIATSTAVEQVFSLGRQVLHFTRNRSTPKAVRAFLCLGSWFRCGLITVEDIIKAMKGGSKKRKVDETEE